MKDQDDVAHALQELIALTTHSLSLSRNQTLHSKTAIDQQVYFVESGSVRIFLKDHLEEQNIRFGYQDNLFVLLDSFFTGKASALNVQALKKTTLRVVTYAAAERFFERDENRPLWKNIVEQLIVQQFERETDLLTTSPGERYQRVLERSPKLFQEIPHKHIANYLRMSPETLSRLKKS